MRNKRNAERGFRSAVDNWRGPDSLLCATHDSPMQSEIN